MPYLSFIKSPEGIRPPQALMDAMDKFVAESLKNGSVIQTGGLGPSSQGFRVRAAKGKLTVTDGPFTEAKEVLGGYAVLAAKTHDEALRNARLFMELHTKYWPEWEGECEVREIVFLAPSEAAS